MEHRAMKKLQAQGLMAGINAALNALDKGRK